MNRTGLSPHAPRVSTRVVRFAGVVSALILALAGLKIAPNESSVSIEMVEAGEVIEAGVPADSALEGEIRRLNAEMVAAVARRDAASVARFYADDARLIGPRRQTVRGREAIDRYWAALTTATEWKLEVVEVGGTRAAAYQVGVSSLTTIAPNGTAQTYTSDFVVIWKRQPDGSLRITLDLYT